MSNLVKSNINQIDNTDLTPIEIVLGVDEEGRTTAKKLYAFLELDKSNYSKWAKRNIIENEFAEENIDFISFVLNDECGGAKTYDYKLSASFAKKLAIGTNNQKGELAKEYFIKIEDKLKKLADPYSHMSKELKSIFVLDEKTQKIESRVNKLESDMPLFNVECKEVQALVRKTGIKVLGGYRSKAYKDNSLRGKVYADIQHELKREFGVSRYEAIKRCQLNKAQEIISSYKAPTVLSEQITLLNNQISI